MAYVMHTSCINTLVRKVARVQVSLYYCCCFEVFGETEKGRYNNVSNRNGKCVLVWC